MHRSLLTGWLCCLCLLSWYGCQPEPGEGMSGDPQTVLRAYQAFYDQNMFDEARELSTPAEQERLTELETILLEEARDSTVLHTSFEQIQCTVNGDTAICHCTLQDQYERYQARFQLIRSDGQWLVDAPHQEQLRIDEELDRIMDSLLHNSSESF